ncbi:bifunctional N(6)-L-threonylcarbamoyladenine synthase/serine/threonine protein kinase [Candidatus Woesearchaeota archaeon]|nr:bifunctional N(6)-L-threonylcarbamoyladenine synthase/serine/threonine protein kinase [Candidatus Woesearchaeota archaeon]
MVLQKKSNGLLLCLGIESTAHTFGIAVVDENGRILSNIRAVHKTTRGGLIPADVADHHVKVCHGVLAESLATANVGLGDIDLVSYSQSPGIGNCLRVGAMFARILATLLEVPIIGVNHCIAHLEIGKLLTAAKDPVFLYVSGANTQVIAYEGGRYRVFGETIDIGVGNFLDTFARHLGLGFPGGPKIHQLSLAGKQYVELPYVVKGMDVSFGGLLTNIKQKYDTKEYTKEDLCFSLQETAYAMLVEVTERAMAHCGKNELLLGGGVASNSRLQEMCRIMCEERGARAYVLPTEYNVDNGAMIAWLGILEYNAGKRMQIEESNILPYLRTDEAEVFW